MRAPILHVRVHLQRYTVAQRARGGKGPDVRPLCRHLGRTVALRTFTFQIDVFLASKSCL